MGDVISFLSVCAHQFSATCLSEHCLLREPSLPTVCPKYSAELVTGFTRSSVSGVNVDVAHFPSLLGLPVSGMSPCPVRSLIQFMLSSRISLQSVSRITPSSPARQWGGLAAPTVFLGSSRSVHGPAITACIPCRNRTLLSMVPSCTSGQLNSAPPLH